MVLLQQQHTFAKLYFKLENHHQSEELSASLDAFRSEVSNFIGNLALDLKPGGSENTLLSLSWIERCFGILPFTNEAFSKLVVDIGYPMGTWEVDSIEGYLSYSVCLLDLFNSIASAISHLGQQRLSLFHGLETKHHLKAIQPGCCCFKSSFGEDLSIENDKERIFKGKEWVVNEAVKEMKSIGFWVCGILLSGLCCNDKPYMELRRISGGFGDSLVPNLDSKISEQLMEKNPVLKEVKEINDAVGEVLVAASDKVKHDAAEELQTKLHVFEKILDLLKAEVDDLFNKVMTQRTELIDCFRLKKPPQESVL